MKAFYLFLFLAVFSGFAIAQPVWQKNLDSKIEFYQTTDFGLLIVGTEKSLYAVDGQSGEVVWRRKHAGLDETSILPVPATDLILVSLDLGDKSRLEAIDVISGDTIWRSDKVKGDVMQLAVEPANDLLCVVMAKKARGKSDRNLKRKPVTHALRLSNGKEIWKRELDSDIEMMPAEFGEDKEVNFTLDNYRAPLIVDDRVYLFYEGATILNASNGKELERDKFKVNESGLALTEADPVLDERFIYVSGRGRVRAIDRQSGKTVWKADDLGVTSEMYLVGQRLFVKTGGQFTRLKDGETEEKGPFGITAIDTKNGKTIWRYKGADKGITNFVFRDAGTIILADRDDLILLNAENGKRIAKTDHKIEKAQFVIMNERGEVVVGGREEISGFGQAAGRPRVSSGTQSDLSRLWTAKHKAPGRGVFRIMAAIALRATALYFRYGGLATSAFSFARSGINLANTVTAFRVSGLQSRFGAANLSTLASNYAKNYVSNQVRLFGTASRIQNFDGLRLQRPNIAGRLTPSREDIQERLFDRLDPTRQLEKLSDFLLKRRRMAEFRGNYMYFYTDLPKPFDKKGLIGINVHTGQAARFILASEPDSRFLTDETSGLLYSVKGGQLQAFDVLSR